jgi:hypothetical protein
MTFIYRVESDTGRGCYTDNKDICLEFALAHNSLNGHPCPNQDKGIDRNMGNEEICGFISVRQFKQWFTKEERRALYEEGFKLKRIEVKEITAIGEKQVLAIR